MSTELNLVTTSVKEINSNDTESYASENLSEKEKKIFDLHKLIGDTLDAGSKGLGYPDPAFEDKKVNKDPVKSYETGAHIFIGAAMHIDENEEKEDVRATATVSVKGRYDKLMNLFMNVMADDEHFRNIVYDAVRAMSQSHPDKAFKIDNFALMGAVQDAIKATLNKHTGNRNGGFESGTENDNDLNIGGGI